MTLPLPRLAAFTIEREQISAWLTRHARVPLRLVLAPAGSGKTTALVRYARAQPGQVLYVHLKYRTEDRSLEEYLRDLFDLETFDFANFVAKLNTDAHVDLIIDGIEEITAQEVALLERLVYEMPANVGLIYAGTRSSIAVHRLEAGGLAKVLPRDEVFFSLQEIQELCDGLGLAADDEQLFAIYEHCNGWAIAVADVLRCALEHDASLVDAYERWTLQRGRSFSTYIQEEVARFSDVGRAIFEKVLLGDTIRESEMTLLEDTGAFILSANADVRPYRVVSDLLARPVPSQAIQSTRIAVRMFGRFSIRNSEREVTWIRRRDQQLFRYIAVRPSGRVKKADIIDVFWPEADQHLAAQSLRTACSNIRKALAGVMDPSLVEQFFVTEGQELCVNLERAVVDVRRFKTHITEGNEAEGEGRLADALAHYRAAERLYRADLFGGEPDETWFLPQREVYRDMAALASERASLLRAEIAEVESVTEEFANEGVSAASKNTM